MWKSAPIEAGPRLLSYSWISRAAIQTDDAALTRLSTAPRFYKTALQTSDGLKYPLRDFETLEALLEQVAPDGVPVVSLPSEWLDIAEGVMMPFETFETMETATHFKVVKQFNSKAKPWLVELKNETRTLKLVMKIGDDLRQDQLALSAMGMFNQIWLEAGVMYTTAANRRVPVEAPLYRVTAAGQSKGFVEMLANALPVDDVHGAESRGNNDWKACSDILPSSVAAFAIICCLNVKDRHEGNMVVVDGQKLANIDFGWLEEGPTLGPKALGLGDTGEFPIPDGLKKLLSQTKQWDEFHDLMFDAIKTLDENMDRIVDHWQAVMRQLDFDADRFLYTEVPERMKARVSIDRDALDKELRKFSIKTKIKHDQHVAGIVIAEATEKGKALLSAMTSGTPRPQSMDGPEEQDGQRDLERHVGNAGGGGGASARTLDLQSQLEAWQDGDLDAWLAKYKVEQYAEQLKAAGCDSLLVLYDADEEDIAELTVEVEMPKLKAKSFIKNCRKLREEVQSLEGLIKAAKAETAPVAAAGA